MATGTWAVLPVKPFDDAKSRLQTVLDSSQRRDLARALMQHSLRTLLACDGIECTLAVSNDPEALSLAAGLGAGTLAESGLGLNQALEEARLHATARGATSLLVVAGDLPLLDAADLDAMLAQNVNVVIAPDRRGQGTNALLLRPPGAIGFCFGEISLQRHRQLAVSAGLTVVEVRRQGLAFDIDLPQDLQDLLSQGWQAAPQPSSSRV